MYALLMYNLQITDYYASEIASSFVMTVNIFHYLSCVYQYNLDNRSEHFGKNSR